MTTAVEHTRSELLLMDDPRLMPALLGVVSYVAKRAELPVEEEARLAEAAEQACQNTFPLLNRADPMLKLVVEDFPDRIEITLEHSGTALPSAGLDSFASHGQQEPAKGSGALLLTQVDRVLYETRNGRSRMTLVKYTGKCLASD
jgi:hypothetical protein